MGLYEDNPVTSQTEAACKMRAVERFTKMRDTAWEQRESHARTLALKQDRSPSGVKVERWQTVNLGFRYMQGLMAEVTGEPLHLKMSRDAGQGQSPAGAPEEQAAAAPGDEQIAEWVEKGVLRVLYEAHFQRETNAVVMDLGAYGVSGWWLGYHAEVVGLEEAADSAKDISGDPLPAGEDPAALAEDQDNIIAETMRGDLEAKPGQDHRSIAMRLRDAAARLPKTSPPEVMQALLMRAQSHDVMYAQEEKAKGGPTRELSRTIWVRRGIVGLDTFWHPGVCDTDDTPWFCRRVLEPLESFKRAAYIKPKYRRAAKGKADRYRPSVSSKGSNKSSDEYRDQNDPYDLYVETYVFWIRQPWRQDGGIRKIACPEFPGEWIETNEANPFVSAKTGRPLIDGFFPFFPCAPLLPPLNEDPERTLATPLIEPGARTLERIGEFLSTIVAHYKRHGFRVYALHWLLRNKRRLKEALRRGEDGFSFDAPEGVKDAKDLQHLVVPIQFSGQAEQLERMLTRLIEFWRIEQAVPAAVLLGQAQSDTATQESIGVEAGHNEMGVITSMIEEPVGNLARGVLGLMREFYNKEKMRELLGSEGAQAWDLYRQTSTVGDRLDATLGLRARRQNAVDKKQLMEGVDMHRTTLDPITGLRTLDEMPLIEEWNRSMGLGKPKKLPQAALMAQQMIQGLMMENEALKGGPQGKPEANGKASSGERGVAPSEANINAGARRGTAGGINQ